MIPISLAKLVLNDKSALKPFKERFEEGRKKEEVLIDSKAEFYKKEDLEIVQDIKQKMWKALKNLNSFNPDTITLNQFVDAMEKLSKLQQYLCGEAESISHHEHIHTIKLDLPPAIINQIIGIKNHPKISLKQWFGLHDLVAIGYWRDI